METFLVHRSRSLRQAWSTLHLQTHFINRKWKPSESGVRYNMLENLRIMYLSVTLKTTALFLNYAGKVALRSADLGYYIFDDLFYPCRQKILF